MDWLLWEVAGSAGGWRWCAVRARERLRACAEQVLQLKNVRCHYTLMNQRRRRRRKRGRREEVRVAKRTKRTCGGEKQRRNKRRGTAANEEDAFRNGLGRVCGEPVARQWVRRSGSKRLFLSSEFPGSRLAAIPGTGVTFPAEPTEQGERGGGPCAHTHALMHMHVSKPHTRTPTLTHTHCAGILTPPFALSFSFQPDKQCDAFTHTVTLTYTQTHTCMPTCMCVKLCLT